MEGKTKLILLGIGIFLIPYVLYKAISLPLSITESMGSFYIIYLIFVLVLLFIISCLLFSSLKKNNSPYWLLGISIAVIISILLQSIPILGELPQCQKVILSGESSGMCGLFTANSFIIPLVFIPVCAIIGFIIGRIKSRKSENRSLS